MACFAGPHAHEFATKQLQFFSTLPSDAEEEANEQKRKSQKHQTKESPDSDKDATVAAICLSLSCLKMDKQLAAKLCFVGISLAFYHNQSSAMDLIASSIRQYAGNPFESNLIPAELVEYIETCTALPISSALYYSLFLMIAEYCDNGNTESVARQITSNHKEDAYFSLIKCIYDATSAEEMATLDYGESLAAIEAAAVLIFKHTPGLPWDAFLEKIIDTQADGFKSFNSAYPPFSKGVAESAKSPHLMGLLTNMRAMSGGDQEIPAILYSNFSNEMGPIKLTNEQIQYLVLTLFPEQ